MSGLRCIAVDDEPLALEVIKRFAGKIPELELLSTFGNPLEAIQFLRNEEVDLIFLDINMPDLTGMQLLESLSKLPMIIFTTAYSQYAVDSYELDATDYLLKPIPFDRFLKAVNKAFREKKAMADLPKDGFGDYLFIKSDTRFFKVNYDDILFIEGMRDYVAVHTGKQKILTLMSMTRILEKLPPTKFMRVHKSYIIGIHHIELVHNHRIRIAGREIPISNSYRESFQEFVDQS
ncbi:MAG: LytTR family DNA-binding domain-containing protein [Bacteroidia bacterium]|nr:LytTR family DNA-binding domain-containing protein [Bacteroidia bacterium]